MNHFLNFFSLFSNINGPRNFPGPSSPGLQHMNHVPVAPTLSLGVPFSEIESILDRGRGGLTIPHSIRSHFLEQQSGFGFPLQHGPIPFHHPQHHHQQQAVSPGVPVTEIINILNRMRSNPNQSQHDHTSGHTHNRKSPDVQGEHPHQTSKDTNAHPLQSHSHNNSESSNTGEKGNSFRNISTSLHDEDDDMEDDSNQPSDSPNLESNLPRRSDLRRKQHELNSHIHSKSLILERLGKETNQKSASKSNEKSLLDQGSKALIKRFKDPIGFHQILNDMDVQISSFPKSIGNYLKNITNSSANAELSDDTDDLEADDGVDLPTASVECNSTCPKAVQCSFGFRQGVCPRCECAPDPCAENTCSQNEQCIRVPNDDCADKNSTMCPPMSICEDIECGCTSTWEPVCGTDSSSFVRTYINNCSLNCHMAQKVYDGECWPSEIPVFYFQFNDTDDDKEDDNKTSIPDIPDPDDIIFEMVNETEVNKPKSVKTLDIYENEVTTTRALITSTDTPYSKDSVDSRMTDDDTTIETTSSSSTTTTTTSTTTSTMAPTTVTTNVITTTTNSPLPTTVNKYRKMFKNHKKSTSEVRNMVIPKAFPFMLRKSVTSTPHKLDTTTQNDILMAKQIIQDLEQMVPLPSIRFFDKIPDSYIHGRQNATAKKVQDETSFDGRLALLENDIPRIPKELLHDLQIPRYTSKPEKTSKSHSHSRGLSSNVKSKQELAGKTDSGTWSGTGVNSKRKIDDDLMFESDDDFTGQDLPKLFQILNEYRGHGRPWSRQ